MGYCAHFPHPHPPSPVPTPHPTQLHLQEAGGDGLVFWFQMQGIHEGPEEGGAAARRRARVLQDPVELEQVPAWGGT